MKTYRVEDERSLISRQLKRYNTIYLMFASAVIIVSIGFIIRAFLKLNFVEDSLYFSAFFLVFIVSVLFFVVLLIARMRNISDIILSRSVHIFSLGLIIWATIVSYLDVIKGESVVIFLAILVLVGGIIIINPIFYSVSVLLTSSILYTLIKINDTTSHRQLYLDLVIFILVALFLCYRHYRVSLSEFKMTRNLEELSYRDQLTQVFNRRSLDETLSTFLKEKQTFIIGMLDLDDFKRINDSYGHGLGDEVLIVLGQQLKEKFGNMIYRFGGDEFCVLDTKIVSSEVLNKKIDSINELLKDKYGQDSFSISAGFCYCLDEVFDAKEALKKADDALYHSKNTGKSRCSIYGEDIYDE